jgi:hypothetical protein
MLESRSRPRPAVLGDLWEDHAGRIAGQMLTQPSMFWTDVSMALAATSARVRYRVTR